MFTEISNCIERYQKEPCNQASIAELCQFRLQVANQFSNLLEHQLESAYTSYMGQAHKMLVNSGIKNEPIIKTESK